MEVSIHYEKNFCQPPNSAGIGEPKCFTDGTMRFAEKLLQLRERARLSQDELGVAIGASGPTIHRWEKGTGGPSLKQAVDMAVALGVELVELAYENPPESAVSLPDDERYILKVYRGLRIDEDEAFRRLTTPIEVRPPAVQEPEHGTARVRGVRDMTFQSLRDLQAASEPAPVPPPRSKTPRTPERRGRGDKEGNKGGATK